ncbi:MAG: preprotein translocase subunit YajC [Selenomonadaceae bacterium]|nr:preprotein translocase subunit YajC [Selenomonadaceae bacterium]
MSGDMMAGLMTWGPALLMVLMLYFLLIRPQKKAQKKRNEMLEKLKRGDKVITIGGLYGTIVDISEKQVKLSVEGGVRLEFARSAISANITEDGEET